MNDSLNKLFYLIVLYVAGSLVYLYRNRAWFKSTFGKPYLTQPQWVAAWICCWLWPLWVFCDLITEDTKQK